VTGGNVFNIAGNVNILSSKSIAQTTPQIDWLDRSYQLLTAQKHLTTNGLLKDSTRNFDHIHVSLGLIERKERPKVKEEPSPERGSEFYQTEYTETKRFEHQAFLADVVGDRVAGKHIAIIGEPGAGKTTILTKIGEYLIRQAEQQPEQPFVVAWVSLAAVGDRPLQKYLQDEWLQKVCEDDFEAAWQEWRLLRQQGRVWLLLDGLDEMSGDALGSIYRDLGQAWAQNLRVAMTCRINQWEAAAGGNILTNSFDVYRTLDYSYQTSQGEDQVEKFISNWFGDKEKEVANQIRRELDAPGKERIKDLVKNPLRLTLLCASWEQDNQALPETQANLYQGFVNYLYGWKAKEFQEEVKLKDKLNLALGELAKAGLNRTSINDGAVRRFRFTASEIRELWQDLPDTLLPAAEKLGWLNVVGKEKKEDLYAFYHPTFQEYFTACSIDDWDYFLPRAHIDRPVNCQDEEKPTYRVFEQEWRQVILLWMGRRDEVVTDKIREEFIDKLTNFFEQEGTFYYFIAYCMAAICVGEFKSSRRGEEIVQQIVIWAFGYFNTEEQEWKGSLPKPISSLIHDTIPFTHLGYASNALTARLVNSVLYEGCYDWQRSDVSEVLGQIDLGNRVDRVAVDALTTLLGKPTIDGWQRPDVAEVLGQIDPGNRVAVDALTTLLGNPIINNSLQHQVVEALGRIAVGDKTTIDTLIALLDNSAPDNQHYRVSTALGRIAVGDKATIDTLTALLENSVRENWRQDCVANVLGQIAVGDRATIDTLTALLEDSAIKDLLKSNTANTVEVLGQIAVGDRAAINALTALLRNPTFDGQQYGVTKALGQIAVDDRATINALTALLENGLLECSVTEALGQIAIGDRATINALTALLGNPTIDNSLQYQVVEALGRIAVGDKATIDTLTALLGNPTIDNSLQHVVIDTLGRIAIGNKATIDTLIALLENPAFGRLSHVQGALSQILTKETMTFIIWQLKNNIIDEVYKSNHQRYQSSYEILFQCSQTLSYLEFHAAWHQTHLPTNPFSP
jgi:HEAT repeat protein